jgi:hypothetical protein
LIIFRPPRHAAMQFDQLNRREFITLIAAWLPPTGHRSGGWSRFKTIQDCLRAFARSLKDLQNGHLRINEGR